MPRAVITATGVVVPNGPAPLEPLHLPGGGEAPAVGCPVQGFDLKKYVPTVTSYIDRCSALALAASKLALESADVLDRAKRSGDWGLAYATAWGCLDSMELFFAKVAAGQVQFAPPLIFSHSYANTPSSLACIEFGLTGSGATFSQGATGAIVALGWARDRLVRTGGSESAGVLVAASDSLSKAVRRLLAAGGVVPGEAGAAVTVELDSAAAARGGRPLAAVLGWSAAVASKQKPEAALAQAVRAALAEADVSADLLRAVYAERSALPEFGAAPRRALAGRIGECGPAAGLVALAEICAAPEPGPHLVTALDASGAAALVVERIP